MSNLGREVRLNRLMRHQQGRFLDITVDHGIARGVIPGLEDIHGLIRMMLEGQPDAITMQKGIAESCFEPYAGKIPLVIK